MAASMPILPNDLYHDQEFFIRRSGFVTKISLLGADVYFRCPLRYRCIVRRNAVRCYEKLHALSDYVQATRSLAAESFVCDNSRCDPAPETAQRRDCRINMMRVSYIR